MSNWRQVFALADYEKSGFIDPKGKWNPVPFGNHQEWAWHQLGMEGSNYQAIENLLKRGWVRVSKLGTSVSVSMGARVTSGVKAALIELATYSPGNPKFYIEQYSPDYQVMNNYFEGTRQQLLERLA